jgi:hypothetical protein
MVRSLLLLGEFLPDHSHPALALWARGGFCGWLAFGCCFLGVAETALSEEIVVILVAVGSKKHSPIEVIL